MLNYFSNSYLFLDNFQIPIYECDLEFQPQHESQILDYSPTFLINFYHILFSSLLENHIISYFTIFWEISYFSYSYLFITRFDIDLNFLFFNPDFKFLFF